MAKKKHKAKQHTHQVSFDQKVSFDLPIVYICAMCQTSMSEPIKAYVKGHVTLFLCSDKCYRGYRDQI